MHEQWTPLLAPDPPHQQSQVKMQQNALKLPEPAVQVQVDPGSPSPNKPVQKDPMAMPASLPSRVPPSRTPSSPLPGSRRISRSAARQLTPQDALYSSLLRSQGSRTPSPSLRPPSTPLTEDGAEGVIDVNQYRSIVHGECFKTCSPVICFFILQYFLFYCQILGQNIKSKFCRPSVLRCYQQRGVRL